MPFSRMACDIQLNVQIERFMHREEEMTVGNSRAETHGDSS